MKIFIRFGFSKFRIEHLFEKFSTFRLRSSLFVYLDQLKKSWALYALTKLRLIFFFSIAFAKPCCLTLLINFSWGNFPRCLKLSILDSRKSKTPESSSKNYRLSIYFAYFLVVWWQENYHQTRKIYAKARRQFSQHHQVFFEFAKKKLNIHRHVDNLYRKSKTAKSQADALM